MRPEDLHGTWRLLTWEQHYDDGRIVLPFGERPMGVITYLGDRMSCVLSRSEREPFRTGGQWDSSDEEKAAAYDECMAYAGSFTVDGDVVTHHIDVSLFPNWICRDQRRHAVLDGDRLSLTARLEEGTEQARTALLAWRRHR